MEEHNSNLTIQEYITVFWHHNRNNNKYIDKMLNLIDSINNEDITDKKGLINEYHSCISNVKGLQKCIDKLSIEQVKTIFDKYDEDFLNKIKKIYEFLILKQQINLNNFINFMYENTAEGRIIKQNNSALNDIQKIVNVSKYINLNLE
jgi:hypothetical protein